jgi:hypothetical protein
MLRQFAAASFEVSGGDVVEQQRAILQVAASQCGFDERLPIEYMTANTTNIRSFQ